MQLACQKNKNLQFFYNNLFLYGYFGLVNIGLTRRKLKWYKILYSKSALKPAFNVTICNRMHFPGTRPFTPKG